jgi:hypothetical protein
MRFSNTTKLNEQEYPNQIARGTMKIYIEQNSGWELLITLFNFIIKNYTL